MKISQSSGDLKNCAGHYALIAGRFNHVITDKLIEGAIAALTENGISHSDIDCWWVPGAFEMPMMAQKLLQTRNYSAMITLGAVIRGETAHFDFVANECARGIARLNIEDNKPIIFGVLTTNTVEQAVERADIKAGNRGGDCALAAMEMVSLLRQL